MNSIFKSDQISHFLFLCLSLHAHTLKISWNIIISSLPAPHFELIFFYLHSLNYDYSLLFYYPLCVLLIKIIFNHYIYLQNEKLVVNPDLFYGDNISLFLVFSFSLLSLELNNCLVNKNGGSSFDNFLVSFLFLAVILLN